MPMVKGTTMKAARVSCQEMTTAATTVATACSFCAIMMDDGIKVEGREESLAVKDVAEIVADDEVVVLEPPPKAEVQGRRATQGQAGFVGEPAAETEPGLEGAREIGLKVVAEGIESELQRRFLCDNGCDLGQGYWLREPMAASECLRYCGN